MTSIKEAFDSIYADKDVKDNRRFVSLYDQNKMIIENADVNNKETGFQVIQLMSDYALSLCYLGSLSKALLYFNKAIPLLENYYKSADINLFSIPLYELLVWNKGTTLWYLKQYKLAKKEFKNLTINFPDNDKYSNWLKGCEAIKYTYVQNIFWILAAICIALTFIVPIKNKSHLILLYIGTIFFISALIMEGVKYLIRQKK